MRMKNYSIPDRARPGSPTTASGVARRQGAYGSYDTAWLRKNKRKRGGTKMKRQRTVIRMGTLNTGTVIERGKELADIMEGK